MFSNLLFVTLGLMFGSFFSALSYRIPRRVPFIKGRSFCPHCKKTIQWYDNIPLISFLLLRGRCRNCRRRISLRYPLIEAVSAIGFLFLYLNFGGTPLTLFYLLFIFSILVLIFVIDAEHQIIPDSLVFTGIAVTLFKTLIIDNKGVFEGLLAGLLAASFLLAINLLTKGRGMGLGDVKFAVFGGLFFGPQRTLVWLFVAFLTGGITGIILILGRRAGLKDKIAFGPFLVISMAITFLKGGQILKLLLP